MAVIDDTLSYPRVTTVGDFFALLKPRVMSLVVFTGLAGIIVAPGHLHLLTAFTALLCIALAAGASYTINGTSTATSPSTCAGATGTPSRRTSRTPG